MIRKEYNIDYLNIGSDIVTVQGHFMMVLFGFILIKRRVIKFDMCKKTIEFRYRRNKCKNGL